MTFLILTFISVHVHCHKSWCLIYDHIMYYMQISVVLKYNYSSI